MAGNRDGAFEDREAPLALRAPPASPQELALLADLTPDALVLFDLHGEPVSLNAAAHLLLVPRMRVGRRLDAWRLFAEQADVVRRFAAESGTGPVLERRRLIDAEPPRVLELGLHRLPEGRFALVATDVTARERAERRQQQLEQRLQRYEEEQKRQAALDPATGAISPQRFVEVADAELERHLRYGRPFSVVVIAIDAPERLVAAFGDDATRSATRVACRRLRDSLRTLDAVTIVDDGRLHVLLPETDMPGAMVVAERARAQLAAVAVRSGGRPMRFTASLGVATSERGDVLVEQVAGRAEASLDDARAEGGDRVAGAARDTT